MTAKNGRRAAKPSQKNGNKFNQRQAFIEHYLVCWNGSEAARRAGYSLHTANEQAARLLASASVQDAIAARIAELKAGADEILLRLASHSRSSMEDFIHGEVIDLQQARERGKLHLVKKFKVTTITDGEKFERHIQEIELYDAQAATVQLAKLLGLYIDRMKVTIDDVTNRSNAELVDELQRILDSAAAGTRASDSGGTPAAGAGGDGGSI